MKRKDFFKKVLLGSVAVLSFPGSILAMNSNHELKPQTTGVTITSLETFVFKNATFVKITCSERINGWGEADHDYPKLTASLIDEICKPIILGKDPFDTEYL